METLLSRVQEIAFVFHSVWNCSK